jgi:hypothetical protein
MLRFAFPAIAVIFTFPAAAQGLPRYDVKAHCDKIASFGGNPSEMIRQGCFQQEQSAYDSLKASWNGLPATVQSHCDKVARFGGGGTYMILQGCIQQELAAKRSNENSTFRY